MCIRDRCKRALEEKNSQIQRYENIISTTKIQNKAINEQLSVISSEDEELILRKLSELEAKRKELVDIHEKKDRCAAVYAEVNKRHTEITEKVHILSTQMKLAEADLEAVSYTHLF